MRECLAGEAPEGLQWFVRHGLGCGCPAELLKDISVAHPEGIPLCGAPARLLRVGGRLLVLVLTPPDWRAVETALEGLFDWGRGLRERGAYNRFRLVVVTPEAAAAPALEAAFAALPPADERLHLHVIAPEALPVELREG